MLAVIAPVECLDGSLARALRDGDCRILRRLDLPEGDYAATGGAGTMTAVVADVETTGLDPARHRVIELALRRVRFDATGAILRLGRPYCWLEDPGEPLDPAISQLTGLTDAILRDQAIDGPAATAILRSADVRICHNCGFDRPFIERRLPGASGLAWADSLREIDWRRRGFDGNGRALGWLLSQAGFFNPAHRASSDVDSTIALLMHRCEGRGTALAELVATAQRTGWLCKAVGSAFIVKDALKARGYRWLADESVWVREVAGDDRRAEAAWLAEHVYAPEHRPSMDGPAFVEVTWLNRHA